MENQTNQTNQTGQTNTFTKSLKDAVTQILNNADNEIINHCFFQQEGLKPYNGKFYYKGLENTYNALQEAGITTECVDVYGGEGKGKDYWAVYKFSKDNESVYVQFDGWYSSYDGPEFAEWFFVEPKEVQVVQFRRCKQLQLERESRSLLKINSKTS